MMRRLFLAIFVFGLLTTQMSFGSLLEKMKRPLQEAAKRALMRGTRAFSASSDCFDPIVWNQAYVRSLGYTRLGLSPEQVARVQVLPLPEGEGGIWISHDEGCDPRILYSGLLASHCQLPDTRQILAWQALHALAHIAGGSLPALRAFEEDHFPGILTPDFRERRWQLARSFEERAVAVANDCSSVSEKQHMRKELDAMIEAWLKTFSNTEERDERRVYGVFDSSEPLVSLPDGHLNHSLTYASIKARIEAAL